MTWSDATKNIDNVNNTNTTNKRSVNGNYNNSRDISWFKCDWTLTNYIYEKTNDYITELHGR